MEKKKYENSNQKSPDLAGHEHSRPDTHRCTTHLIVVALVSALLYGVNRVLITPNWNVPFLQSYLGDFLALPVYLPLSITLAEKLNLLDDSFTLGVKHILGAVLLFAVLFEGLLPRLDASSTSDPRDILAYLGGGIVLLVIANRCSMQNIT